MGIQLVGNQKRNIFAIWDTTENSNTAIPAHANCHRFSGEGTGATCGSDYNWVEGREYRLRLWALISVPGGEQWIGAIYDTVTGMETTIGIIELKNSGTYTGYGWLQNVGLTFQEYFAAPDTCENQPYAKVTWRGPYANANAYIASQANVPSYPSCSTNNVSSAGHPLVTHEAGGTTQQTTPPGTELWQNAKNRVIVAWVYSADPTNPTDWRGNPKSTFKPGDSIAYNFDAYNDNANQVTASHTQSAVGPCGSIWSKTGTFPIGANTLALFNSTATVPLGACAGTYAYNVSITYNGKITSRSTNFTIANIIYLPIISR